MEKIICKECGTDVECEDGKKEDTIHTDFLCGECYEKKRFLKKVEDSRAYRTRE